MNSILYVLWCYLLLAAANDKCHSQPSRQGSYLLRKGYSTYVFIDKDRAYYDTWGGKKNAVYACQDTLKNVSDSLYVGKSSTLYKLSNSWNLNTSSPKNRFINLPFADSFEFKNWIRLVNWINYLQVATITRPNVLKNTDRDKYERELRNLFIQGDSFDNHTYISKVISFKHNWDVNNSIQLKLFYR